MGCGCGGAPADPRTVTPPGTAAQGNEPQPYPVPPRAPLRRVPPQ